jgi:hypothetical protein
VDVKVFLKNLDNDKLLKLTPLFKQMHLNLSEDEEAVSTSSSDKEPQSEIKTKIKHILMSRCGVKIDELS